ncbi:MAG: tRNA (adenosine(37)-N6)-threonylcarbamoyltransferase complex dimerization subunit type 1 TsaB [Caldilineaceae bacterium]|nr:tRNA (adenosine(37)-N6)-threonylcarbamoyltransferase complex dimerization subunit type 1 TsaB [Caldilineaceae bacterium]
MLLALDTATAVASLAVYDLDHRRLLAELSWESRRRQTQDLLVTARDLLQRLELTPNQLTALAVTTGPGSFTGVRIAISAVKGIGLGLPQVPEIIGLPTLSVAAAPWLAAAVTAQAMLCACIQAGRGRYNWAYFRAGAWLHRPDVEEHYAGTAADFAAALALLAPQPVWLVGETAADLVEAVQPLAHVTTVNAVSGLRRAGNLAWLAAEHLAAGHAGTLEALQPLYLRQP